MSRKFPWGVWSLAAFIIGLLAWVPNLLGVPRAFWVWTFIVNPLGVLLGIIGITRRSRYSLFGAVANALMSISFFILMFLGYLTEYFRSPWGSR